MLEWTGGLLVLAFFSITFLIVAGLESLKKDGRP